jgi:hypothetical protein
MPSISHPYLSIYSKNVRMELATIPLFSLSNAQFRRSTAELVGRRLLHYGERQMFLS